VSDRLFSFKERVQCYSLYTELKFYTIRTSYVEGRFILESYIQTRTCWFLR